MGMVSTQLRTPITVLPAAAPLVLRGVVTDAASGQGLPGVTVLVKGTTIGTTTDADGHYELSVPLVSTNGSSLMISVSYVGFAGQERILMTHAANAVQAFQMKADNRLMGEVVITSPRKLPPAPWHPRAFYHWGKYCLTRPFRRY